MSEPAVLGSVLAGMLPECKHERTEVRYKTFANGTKHLCTQCLACGVKTDGSAWLPQVGVDMATVHPFDEGLQQRYHQERERQRAMAMASDRRKKHEEYERYIRDSNDWWAIRTKVMRRDDHLCQACMENAATDVHHRNYTHLYDEVLYDLVAVCRECHKKIHGRL